MRLSAPMLLMISRSRPSASFCVMSASTSRSVSSMPTLVSQALIAESAFSTPSAISMGFSVSEMSLARQAGCTPMVTGPGRVSYLMLRPSAPTCGVDGRYCTPVGTGILGV